MAYGIEQQKLAMESGAWPLYRFDPRRIAKGEAPLQLDSSPPKVPLSKYMQNENRFRVLEGLGPDRYRAILATAQQEAERRYSLYQQLSTVRASGATPEGETPATSDEKA